MVQAPSITTTVAEGLRGQYSNNDRTSRGGTRLLHCGIPVPSMTAMGQKQTSRRHLANLRFASQSRHARVASRSPAQKPIFCTKSSPLVELYVQSRGVGK